MTPSIDQQTHKRQPWTDVRGIVEGGSQN